MLLFTTQIIQWRGDATEMASASSWKKWDILLFRKLFSRFTSRCPFSGVELRGQVYPQVLICRKFGWNSWKCGYRGFDTFVYYWVSDFFLRKKKQHFWSSASVRIAEHEKSICHFQANVQWFEVVQRLMKVCSLDSSHHFYHLPLHRMRLRLWLPKVRKVNQFMLATFSKSVILRRHVVRF